MSWMLLWKVMFVLVMTVFAVMATLVTLLGARDIRKLLKALGGKDVASGEVQGKEKVADD